MAPRRTLRRSSLWSDVFLDAAAARGHCPSMAVLALFQPDVRARARLADALGDEHDLVTCESWKELWETASDRPVDGCVVDPYNLFDPVSLPELLHFRRRFAALAIVVYADFEGREMDLYHLGRLGVDAVVLAGRDDGLHQLRDRIDLALSASLATRVTEALGPLLPDEALRCMRWCIEHAQDHPQVPDLGRAMRRSPRSLARWLRSRDLPAPRHLLLWGRLFQAARMLEVTDVTVEEAAFRLGYSTAASLARAFREHVGVSPGEIAGPDGGVERVLDAFGDALDRRSRETPGPRRWSTAEVRRAVRSFRRDD